jgi:dihydrodipicolinate synthase/N-acetylneuraminate lyase
MTTLANLSADYPTHQWKGVFGEYLLPTLLEAGDGALIGFAGFAPELMIQLVDACVQQDLNAAKQAQRTVAPLARLIYDLGEPGCSAHQRMKTALWAARRHLEPGLPSTHPTADGNPSPAPEAGLGNRRLPA